MKRFDPKNKYFGWGITAFGVIACSILFFMLLQHGKSISGAIGTLIGILSPIIWGGHHVPALAAGENVPAQAL